MERSILTVPIHKFAGGQSSAAQDLLAVEEPLQIRLGKRDVAIAMRTPGHDEELAAGFLKMEGILENASQIVKIVRGKNTVSISLQRGVRISPETWKRHFYRTSSCGVCGKASIDSLRAVCLTPLPRIRPLIAATVIQELPERLRASQDAFSHTGGLHAAGLFELSGQLLLSREDVGRHNAVDKLIGRAFLDDQLPLSEHILMLSGRASFELIQKALMAGIPMVAAVGAPSSLAVETALRFRLTLIGFVRDGRFNVYSAPERVYGSK